MTKFGLKRHAGWLAALAVAVPNTLAIPVVAVAATPAPLWNVNMAASRLRFQSSVGGEQFIGTFTRWRADIRFDPKNLAGSSVLARIDMASAKTGSSDKDEAMPGAEWFAVSKFAQATYAAKTFKDLGGGRYQAIGTLTLRGVTRPLTLPFTLQIQGDQARMTGSAMVDRHAFGVGQGQYAAADTVPFGVRIGITINAKRG